jgi:hypothetical protein
VAWAVAGRPAVAAFPVTSDSLPLAAAYGQGVHAFHAGDYQRSYDDLSQAIVAGTQDPRAYYFRGLAALRLGRLDEAEADFSSGAEREMNQSGDWRVGRSLERVQGVDRLRLERHRSRARITALQSDREATRRRYSEIEDAQDEVLRRRRRPSGGPVDAGNPFEDDAAAAPGRASSGEPDDDVAKPSKPAAEELPPMKEEPDSEPADDAKPADGDTKPADGDTEPADTAKPADDADAADKPDMKDAPADDADATDKPDMKDAPADDDPFDDKKAEAKAEAEPPEAEATPEPSADN